MASQDVEIFAQAGLVQNVSYVAFSSFLFVVLQAAETRREGQLRNPSPVILLFQKFIADVLVPALIRLSYLHHHEFLQRVCDIMRRRRPTHTSQREDARF